MVSLPDSWIRPPLRDGWFLTGPTASGKTSIGLGLAELLDAEILSMDSMAIYRGMDIGTAKPTPEQRSIIPHHLIDIIHPTEDFSLSQYVDLAHRISEDIRARGKQVLIVGGTPLYLKALTRGLFLGPPADWEFRREVEEDAAKWGLDALRQRLEHVDPVAAHKILPGDLRRMTRALEVAKITGKPLSHWQTQFERIPIVPPKAAVLQWNRADLHARVNQRVEQMFQRGLIEETKHLLQRHGPFGRTASQALGYREVLLALQDEIHPETLTKLIEEVKAHTRQFVRRQEIWFRSMPELVRIPMTEPFDPHQVAARIVEHLIS